jgi:predicted heme/steroid binding protein/YHS domain-containing protein
MKTILSAVLFLSFACAAAAGDNKAAAPAAEAWRLRTFTAEELKKYNGKDGMPAYAAVDGIVYDLTSDIKEKAPQGIHKGGKILEKMPKVGVLAATPVIVKAEQPAAPALAGVSLHKITPGELGLEERCAVTRKPLKVAEATPAAEYKSKVYYFSSVPLLEQFSKDPEKYLGKLEKVKGLLKKKA